MDRRSINQQGMQKKTFKLLDENRSIFNDNPIITGVVDRLGVYNDEIDALNDVQTGGTKGNTTQKIINKEKLITAICIVKSGLLAYAASIKDQKIIATLSVPDASLGKIRESDFLSFARVVLDLAKKNATELLKWNTQQVKIDNLESAIDAFSRIIPTNHNAKAEITQTSVEIKQKLKDAKALLDDELDLMIAPFGVDNPGFYALYLKAREIIDIAATHSTEETPATNNNSQNN
ncbi:hypothetical protein [Parabacteroides sp. FAFU027]|uniref:hypothetical protein n=1 Tax=Parabacteroides sp. FAFU027 TaxID=2922715 RepID=UPI001FAF9282|nr:hypothetical protein [Parabacteroides sp. FAFU027]